jgi:hypothetical protein
MDGNNIKLNDIYRWHYTSEKFNEVKKWGEPYWAVSRFCIVKKSHTTGELYLEDTFWSSENKTFYLNELNDIQLEYLGNFEELNKFTQGKHSLPYYNPSDIVDISHSNSFQDQIYIKKDAKRSLAHTRAHLEHKENELLNKVVWAQRELEQARELLKNLNEENLDKVWM